MIYSKSMPIPIDMDFIIDKCPLGLLVFDKKIDIIYFNKRAELFFKRYELPVEIRIVSERIFKAIEDGTVSEMFPGEIYITNRLDSTQSNWMFRLYICDKPTPLVYVTISEERLSNKLEMNGIRRKFRLTRRETDVVRRVIDGLKNNVEIADDLAISEQTVKDHLSNIYMKTGVANKLALVRTLMHVSAEESD